MNVSNITSVCVQKHNTAFSSDQKYYVNNNTSTYSNAIDKDNIYFASKQKKTWLKMLIGTGLIGIGVYLIKGKFWAKEKPIAFEKIQKHLAEIFEKKNLTKEEAANSYRNIKKFII